MVALNKVNIESGIGVQYSLKFIHGRHFDPISLVNSKHNKETFSDISDFFAEMIELEHPDPEDLQSTLQSYE